jgi:CMP-N,N'-diacetyllegionaminic acid synthase
MIQGKKIIAIIPARGGSKGLPGKNIRLLNNKPLLNWTIDAAKGSKYIDNVILSSDDEKIMAVALEAGCKVPFVRPDYLSTDKATSIDVVKHAISNIKESYEIIILLQPTSPFRTSKHSVDALYLMIKMNKNSIVSVTLANKKPEWMYRVDNQSNKMEPVMSGDFSQIRRQEIEDSYVLNGAIYVVESSAFLRHESFLLQETIACKMDKISSIDIDSYEDFKYAEFLIDYDKYITNRRRTNRQ